MATGGNEDPARSVLAVRFFLELFVLCPRYIIPFLHSFPLGASNTGPQNVADRALDSFGVSISLLEFHEIQSRCPNGGSEISKPPVQDAGNEEDEEDDTVDTPEREHNHPYGPLRGVSDIAKHPQHAVKRAPFVVTRCVSDTWLVINPILTSSRTQIRIVDETHIFNRKAYNKEHNKLKTTSVCLFISFDNATLNILKVRARSDRRTR